MTTPRGAPRNTALGPNHRQHGLFVRVVRSGKGWTWNVVTQADGRGLYSSPRTFRAKRHALDDGRRAMAAALLGGVVSRILPRVA